MLSHFAILSLAFCTEFIGNSNSAIIGRSNGFPGCPIPKGEEGNTDTLVAVQIIIRHGIRRPIINYPNDPYKDFNYAVDLGELLPVGKKRSFILGRCLRQSYDHFLGPDYTPEKFVCQSSEVDRTMMTGSLAMAGLFPPTELDPNSQFEIPEINWQPIPCKSISQNVDNKIFNSATVNCDAFVESIKEFNENGDGARHIKENRWLYNKLTEVSGKPIKNYMDSTLINDAITIQIENFGLTPPPWYPPLKTAMDENDEYTFSMITPTRKIQRLYSGPFWNELVNNFRAIIGEPNPDGSKQNRKSKMYLHSGHDTTIAPMLFQLGHYKMGDRPSHNAALAFELHQIEKEFRGEFYVKIFYKVGFDQPMKELVLKGCTGLRCTFDEFKDILGDLLINDKDWVKECKINKKIRVVPIY